MADQHGFWDAPDEVADAATAVAEPAPGAAGVDDPDTSWAAALKVMGRSGSVRRAVLAYLWERGPAGATNDEIESALGLRRPSGSNRRGDLEAAGLCRATPARRPTILGSPAIVYEITSLGQAVAEHLAAEQEAADL